MKLNLKQRMKKHAIIPIFIPHSGCPHDCIFCNQKKITARQTPALKDDVIRIVEEHLQTLRERGLKIIEIAFFGGSFTGIPLAQQSEYLEVASFYKRHGLIDKIRISTRPDYIDDEILRNLKNYGADVIELGVQSFDDEVLARSNRGHDAKIVYKSSALIKDYGFELGIQLMIGLPGDNAEKSIFSAQETVKVAPSIVRLYPTIVICDTELHRMYLRGEYTPLSQEQAVATTKKMYQILTDAGINIIRIGLKSTDIINENGEICGNTFHPAFRQLVEGEIAKEVLEAQLSPFEGSLLPCIPVTFKCNIKCFSNMIGNNRINKQYFSEQYPMLKISYEIDNALADNQYIVIK